MKNVFLDRIRIRAVTKVSSLLVLGVIIVVFLATPLVSLAHDNASSVSRLGGRGLFGNNGCLSQKDVAKCLVPDLGNLPNVCGNDSSDNGDGSNQDCGIPDLSNLGEISDGSASGHIFPSSCPISFGEFESVILFTRLTYRRFISCLNTSISCNMMV